jgi:hypothetical protein
MNSTLTVATLEEAREVMMTGFEYLVKKNSIMFSKDPRNSDLA